MTSRDPLETLVLRAIRQAGAPPPGARVVVGLSGGPDSTCLLHVLLALAPTLGWRVEAAHLHHGLRGDSADGDEAFCRALCAALDVPLTVRRADVARLAAASGQSLETCGRFVRYAFLRECAGLDGFVAVAHHRDDQAETLLLNLSRGAGLDGLAGMRPVAGRLLRPLLSVSRADVLAYLERRGIAYRTDPTNAVPDATRNRVRLEVLPRLDAAFGGEASDRLAQAAALLAEDADYLDAQAAAALYAMRGEPSGTARSARPAAPAERRADPSVPCDALAAQPRPLAARIVRALYAEARGDRRDLSRRATEAVLLLCAPGRPGGRAGRVSLPGGLEARVSRGRLCVAAVSPDTDASETRAPRDAVALRVPGVVEVSGGWHVEAVSIEKPEEMVYTSLAWCFRAETLAGCAVRSRREGDSIRPEGGSGSRSLKRLLIDRKVPREDRDDLLVFAVGDRVLWVPGVAVDADASARAASPSESVGTGPWIRIALVRTDGIEAPGTARRGSAKEAAGWPAT